MIFSPNWTLTYVFDGADGSVTLSFEDFDVFDHPKIRPTNTADNLPQLEVK